MKQSAPYEQTLRAIGQALEAQHFNAFNLKRYDDKYFIRGEQKKINALQVLLQKWQGRYRKDKGPCQLSYTHQDIARLEREGRTKRRGPHTLPDLYSLPNILRTVGAYLDMKGAELLQVNKQDLTITILYKTNHGHPEVEERTIASFYSLYLQMYERRQKKNPN